MVTVVLPEPSPIWCWLVQTKTPNRFYSLSTQIESERKEYYKQLENQQRGSLDITGLDAMVFGLPKTCDLQMPKMN